MKTLTLFLENIFNEEIGSDLFLTFRENSKNGNNYIHLSISGTLIDSCLFENVHFEDCTFWATSISQSLFINCYFKNCKFQFTEFTNCNFDEVSFENCIWGVSKLSIGPDSIGPVFKNNLHFESSLPIIENEKTRSLSLFEINQLYSA